MIAAETPTQDALNLSQTKRTIIPLYDKVLVKRDDKEEKVGSIYLPQNNSEAPDTGIVLEAGEGYRDFQTGALAPLKVKKGDRVLFSRYAGMVVKVGLDEALVMSETDIVGIVREEPVEAEPDTSGEAG